MEELYFNKQFSRTTVWCHGTTSTQVISLKDGIDVYHSKRNCDFGIGFYMTSKFSQAVKWAKRKTKYELPFNPDVKPIVLSYEFQDFSNVKMKIFEIDREYFQFVYKNRLELNVKSENNIHDFSAVFGPVLDGKVTYLRTTLDGYFEGVNTLEETVDILLGKYQDDTQLCICDQVIADKLKLVEEEAV